MWIQLTFKKYSGIVQILVRYRLTLSRAIFSQLQLWHLHWLVLVQTVGDMYLQVAEVLLFLSDEEADLDIVC
jgi:hypothetical protein